MEYKASQELLLDSEDPEVNLDCALKWQLDFCSISHFFQGWLVGYSPFCGGRRGACSGGLVVDLFSLYILESRICNCCSPPRLQKEWRRWCWRRSLHWQRRRRVMTKPLTWRWAFRSKSGQLLVNKFFRILLRVANLKKTQGWWSLLWRWVKSLIRFVQQKLFEIFIRLLNEERFFLPEPMISTLPMTNTIRCLFFQITIILIFLALPQY